jgi:4-nitrophenyl phosphatase
MAKYNRLENIQHLLIDMDGVLWRGDQPMPNLEAFFEFLRQRPIKFVLATNNSSKSGEHYVKRLAGYGVAIEPDEVITSAQATARYLAQRSAPKTAVYVIGEDGLHESMVCQGFRLVDSDDTPEYVVVGWDRGVNYEKLAQATLHIRGGAKFIGTNPDRTWPGERGLLPGAGAILAALEAATDVEPTVIGKPSPLMLQVAMDRIGAKSTNTAMLGDRLETDILGGQNAGLTTILVLSGVTHPDDLGVSPIHPDLIFNDIAALMQTWMTVQAKASPG